ncbi:hypothetical protein BJ508DRAFT_315197 [Ascobolus immersus RN42]|uniref:Uncharacterized protein n=1 Tax=Ascobolus immersus RN42 TaxID=1160509 RepID=A0A3N4HBW6_ASCIM|nr:hypothetical protein BJ508DRAFT_315197 [Ascobolus immersus RN42]
MECTRLPPFRSTKRHPFIPRTLKLPPPCYFSRDEHQGECAIDSRNEKFAKGLDDSSVIVDHTAFFFARVQKHTISTNDLVPSTQTTRASSTAAPEFVHAKTFVGIIVGVDDSGDTRRHIKLDLKDLSTGAPRLKALVSTGHRVAVHLTWERPEFDRDECVWRFKANGNFYCTHCPSAVEERD